LGNDLIFGADGNNILRGDLNSRSPGGAVGGNDTIYGGNGNDQMAQGTYSKTRMGLWLV